MHAHRFDRLIRSLHAVSSRRGVVRSLAIACGLTALHGPDATESKNKNKNKKDKKKLDRNQYGCVNVGGKCRGRDKHCCSGVCQGKKPRQGEKDTSRCVAHDTGTIENGDRGCLPVDDSFGPGANLCTTTTGEEFGQCWLTTGNAGYCGWGTTCIPGSCRKDADCVAACGAGAACILLPGNGCDGTDTICFGLGACDG